jgi:hypothetical protein
MLKSLLFLIVYFLIQAVIVYPIVHVSRSAYNSDSDMMTAKITLVASGVLAIFGIGMKTL